MPRRCNDTPPDGPPRKKNNVLPTMFSFDLKPTDFLTDIAGKQWRLGEPIGVGGFGEIYLASDNLTKKVQANSKYVAKVESHKNGPLFVEVNCYLRIAKQVMIAEWMKKKRLSSLGVPFYVASGSHIHKNERYRFLILPKFDRDLEKILEEKETFNIKTVFTISSQIIDVLEYIHMKGYIHGDIKASNILLSNQTTSKKTTQQSGSYNFRSPRKSNPANINRSVRNLRPHACINYLDDIPNFEELLAIPPHHYETEECNKDQVYLLDYGLACKYLTSDGQHKQVCIDERKAHAGTILFCSRDAHKGITSRRSDLESLGYNIVYWLTGKLPWSDNIDDPEMVDRKKQKSMANLECLLNYCFLECPTYLLDYFRYLQNLQCKEKPDYSYCKRLFKQIIKAHGYEDDSRLDFDNKQVCRIKPNKLKKKSENKKLRRIVYTIPRPPLVSNMPIKPLLRKEGKNKQRKAKRNWFEVADPESILKQGREKRNIENYTSFNTTIADLNIERLNPTYAMIDVYNKCRERIDASPTYKGDSTVENIDGYTHAMLTVLQRSNKRKELEQEKTAVNRNGPKIVRRCICKRRKKFVSPVRSPPKTRTTKSAQVIKRDHFQTKKTKAAPLRRTYSLRG